MATAPRQRLTVPPPDTGEDKCSHPERVKRGGEGGHCAKLVTQWMIKMKMNADLWYHKCKDITLGCIVTGYSFGLIKEIATDLSASSGNEWQQHRLPPCPSLQWPASRSISTVWALGWHCSIHLRLQTFLLLPSPDHECGRCRQLGQIKKPTRKKLSWIQTQIILLNDLEIFNLNSPV